MSRENFNPAPTFVRVRRHSAPVGEIVGEVAGGVSDEFTVISRAAMHVHSFAVLNSIESGHAGFVSDGYLNAISADTTLAAIELCVAGLWERSAYGYRVADDDTIDVATQIHRQLAELAARCGALGGHLTKAFCPALCARCGTSIGTAAPSPEPC